MLLPTCQYEWYGYPPSNFKCSELVPEGVPQCTFHDKNYLKDDNYEKHKEEVARRFREKLKEYSSNNMPLQFIGYCLPEISLEREQLTELLYFNSATFYGTVNFSHATFSEEAYFIGTTFFKGTHFNDATFSKGANFFEAKFLGEAHFSGATFSGVAAFQLVKFSRVYFRAAIFSEYGLFASAEFFKIADLELYSTKKHTFLEPNSPGRKIHPLLKLNFLEMLSLLKRNSTKKHTLVELHFQIELIFQEYS